MLLWECADAISKAAALACDDHLGVLYALRSRAALSARGHGADARRLERAVAKRFHALPRGLAAPWPSTSWPPMIAAGRRAGTTAIDATIPSEAVLVAFAGLGSRGHDGYEWRGAAHRVSQDQDFDVLFAADPAASWYTGGACWPTGEIAALGSGAHERTKALATARRLRGRQHGRVCRAPR